jgi:integrase/recombinase XerD
MPQSQPANKGKRYPAEPLTDEEAQALVDAIKGSGPLAARNRALVALLWRSGVRITEALSLKPADVDEQQGIINVRDGKGKKARIAVIDGRALGYLRAWLEVRKSLGLNGRQPLFCTVADGSKGKGKRAPGGRVDTSYVRRLLPKLAEAAGIDKRVHAHGLRHTHASELVDRKLPLHHIAAQLGHASTATTDTYLRKLNPAERIEAMRAAGMTLDDNRRLP